MNISMAGIDHSMAGIDIRQRFSLAKSRQQQILQALFHMETVEFAVEVDEKKAIGELLAAFWEK